MHSWFNFFFIISYFGLGSCKLKQVSESYQIALESTSRLLPTEEFAQKITNDLEAIRTQFPDTRKVNHIPKWEPGVLFLTDVKADTIEKLNKSEYGPVDAQSILGNDLYKVMFPKPYNPELLVHLLNVELGINNADPNWVTGRSTYISVSGQEGGDDGEGRMYVFRKSRKPCNFACEDIRIRVFKVTTTSGEPKVELISDSGTDEEKRNSVV